MLEARDEKELFSTQEMFIFISSHWNQTCNLLSFYTFKSRRSQIWRRSWWT